MDRLAKLCDQPKELRVHNKVTNTQRRLVLDLHRQCRQVFSSLEETHDVWFSTVGYTRARRSPSTPTQDLHLFRVVDMEEDICDNHNPLFPHLARCKRQVILGAIALISAASSLYTAYELNELSNQVDHDRKVNMALFKNHEQRLNWTEHAIEVMTDAIKEVGLTMAHLSKMVEIDEVIFHLKNALDIAYIDVARLVRGLQALAMHQFSPDLVHPAFVLDTVETLRVQMREEGYVLGVETANDVFRCETSSLMYEDGLITIFVHLPAYKQDSAMDLYALTPVPFLIPRERGNSILELNPDHDYLAVSSDDTSFKVLTHAELHNCNQFEKMFFCPNSNVYDRRQNTSCLFSLYRQDYESIRHLCHWRVAASKEFALQIGVNDFIIYHSQSIMLKLMCGKRKTETEVQGMIEVKVPAKCRMYTPSFILDGQQQFTISSAVYLLKHLNVSLLWDFPHSDVYDFTEMAEKLKTSAGKTSFTASNLDTLIAEEETKTHWNFGTRFTILLIVLIVFALLLFKIRAWWRNRRNKLNSIQPPGPNLQLNFGNLLRREESRSTSRLPPTPEPRTTRLQQRTIDPEPESIELRHYDLP